jgi:hypothetical protein
LTGRRKKLYNTNEFESTKLTAGVKLRKNNMLIRPVVNNTTTPTYKLGKFALKILKNYMELTN